MSSSCRTYKSNTKHSQHWMENMGDSLMIMHFSRRPWLWKIQIICRIVLNKRTYLNKCTLNTVWWNIPLQIGKHWSKMDKIGLETSELFPWTSWIHQGVCQRTGCVYSALYGIPAFAWWFCEAEGQVKSMQTSPSGIWQAWIVKLYSTLCIVPQIYIRRIW